VNPRLSPKGAKLLANLRHLAIEEQVVCMSAPTIWDGETPEDIRMAKRNCLGAKATSETEELPPCPLLKLCLETALENKETFGVWGGTSPYERRKLNKKRT